MLRESMQTSGKQVECARRDARLRRELDIPHAAALVEFAEAVVLRDEKRTDVVRPVLRSALGEAGLVDARRSLPPSRLRAHRRRHGIPYTTAAQGGAMRRKFANAPGSTEFYRVRNSGTEP